MSASHPRSLRRSPAAPARIPLPLAVLLLAPVVACGDSGTAPQTPDDPPPVLLTGEAVDGTGDALADPALTVLPDLRSARLEKEGGVVRVQVRFADGTYDPALHVVLVLIDTDLDPTSGLAGDGIGNDDTLLGPDRVLFLDARTPQNSFALSCAAPTIDACTGIGGAIVSVTPLPGQGLDVVALEDLGGPEQPVAFKVAVFALEGLSEEGDLFLDYMTDVGEAPTRVQ
ncbi:MAG: hypothetical protein KC645_05890 [Gemmatimonadetes bacterium]|nr:hypothetical protein [Gemmatimonadota bacterium]